MDKLNYELCSLSPKFPKMFKYTLGSRLIDKSLSLLTNLKLIYEAVGDSKLKLLKSWKSDIQYLDTLYETCIQLNCIENSKRTEVSLLISSCIEQVSWWINSLSSESDE